MATEHQNTYVSDNMTYEQFLKLCYARNTKVSTIMHTYGTQLMLNDFYRQIKKGYTMPETVLITTHVPNFEIEDNSHQLSNEDIHTVKSVCSNVAELLNARGFPYKIDSNKSGIVDNTKFKCTFTKPSKYFSWY